MVPIHWSIANSTTKIDLAIWGNAISRVLFFTNFPMTSSPESKSNPARNLNTYGAAWKKELAT